MTRQEYLAVLEKKLLVSSPKREEIIAEVESHLTEANNLGDPKPLAKEENHTHIGFFGDPVRLYLLPIEVMALLLSLQMMARAGLILAMHNNAPYEFWIHIDGGRTIVSIGIVVWTAMLVGRTLPRIHQGIAVLRRLLVISFVALLAYYPLTWLVQSYNPLTYIIDQPAILLVHMVWRPLLESLVATGILSGMVLLTSILTKRELAKTPWIKFRAVRVEAALAALAVILTFIVVILLGVWLEPQIQYHGTSIVPASALWWDVLFNTPVVPSVAAVFVGIIFAKRIQAYRREKPETIADSLQKSA